MISIVPANEISGIKKLPFFASISAEAVEGLLTTCKVRELEEGEVLIAPGQQHRDFYLLLSGRVRVHLQSPDSEPVTFIEQGQPVGEMSIIDSMLTSAYVVADEGTRVLVMGEDLLWSLVGSSHLVALNLLQVLTSRIRNANEVILSKLQQEQTWFCHGSIDSLTGLHNRYWLDTILPRQLQRCTMSGSGFSVMKIDIDNFRLFNEQHGSRCGDRVLHTLARLFMDHLRPTEMAARFGSDEFMVILPDVGLKVARTVGDRLRQKVMYADIVMPDGRKLPSVTVSIGIVEASSQQTLEDLLTAVDRKMRRSKQMGKNLVSD